MSVRLNVDGCVIRFLKWACHEWAWKGYALTGRLGRNVCKERSVVKVGVGGACH